MPHPKVPSRPRALPRIAILALAGVALAGCENSARFDSNPFASDRRASREVTGSVASRPPASSTVVAQPLPAPSQPTTIAANTDTSYGSGYAYRPPAPSTYSAPPPSQANGHWTWDGGRPVTVGYGETLETIAQRNHVPLTALMETNGIRTATAIRPGQRLVIPRYVHDAAPRYAQQPAHSYAPAARYEAPPRAPVAAAEPVRTGEHVHVVQQGEGLMSIARRAGVPLAELARANNLEPYSKLNVGDRLTIPGGRVAAAPPQAPAPQVAEQRTPVREKVASLPTETARVAKPEVPDPKAAVQEAEPAGGIPTFRWPVKGRIIAGFGPRTNGTQNDGINLAVPEGTPIKAADDGVVAYAGNELKGYGNLVLIRHSGGFVSAYANASNLVVKRGETVKRGQVIAHAGQTGNVTSPQLHFEIRKGSTPVDPTKYLSGV
jgi:murein DD-endopeptidase MepM/ murein hydrolase activator NlpD